MSFLTGQDRTPKFAGQVLPDRTKSGLTFLNILLHKNTRKNYEKKNLKKNFWKKKNWKFWKKFFGFFSILKGPESGKEKNRKSGIRTFQNLPDFRTGRDVRLSPSRWSKKSQKLVCERPQTLCQPEGGRLCLPHYCLPTQFSVASYVPVTKLDLLFVIC